MKKHRLVKPAILVLGLALSGMALAKPQVFKWDTELCRASVRYDDQKVTAAQLDATLKLNADRLISLYDAMLLGERVFWDPATDTLTIKGTPPNLRDQLQRRTSGGK